MDEQKNNKCLSIQESQQAALNVLIKFDRICKENNFRYFLIYGTLIGAIRHNGFIPWDDDIDVMMPREDYDRFVRHVFNNSEDLLPFKFHNRSNTDNYWYSVSRFSDMTYKYINLDIWGQNIDIGVFIDIYPWDNYGNSREDAERLFYNVRKENEKYMHYINTKNSNDGMIKSLERKLLSSALLIVKGKDYSKKIDSIVREYILSNTSESDKYIGHLFGAAGIRQYEKSKLMNLEAIPHEFAGHTFNIPAAYDYILRTGYGDYMQLPPEKDRHPTHDYEIIKR